MIIESIEFMDKDKILLSVIVPVYNVVMYLRECIESILTQTYYNLELILVDDGSTDESGIICDEYARKDNRVCVIHKANGGLVSARKIGIEKANGIYVTYVDGDDWIEQSLYESVFYSIKEAYPDVILYGMKEDYPDKTVEVWNKIPCGFYGKSAIETKIYSNILNNGNFFEFGILPNIVLKVVKKELLFKAQNKVWDCIDIGEDVVCTTSLMFSAESVVILPLTGYHYRKRNDSMMGGKTEIIRLKALFQNLYEEFLKQSHVICNIKQLWCYMLFVLLLKHCEEFFKLDTQKGSFTKLINKKVALYGAGGFGQEFYKKVKESNIMDIVIWVDQRYEVYEKYGFLVNPVNDLLKEEFDVVFIAVLNTQTCEIIKQSLISLGINENKIEYVTDSEENLQIVKEIFLKC